MRATPTLAILLGIVVVPLTLLLAAVPCDAAAQQTHGDATLLRVPVPEEGEERIPRLHTRVRHTTVIVLPAGERILDFVAGDSEYWHLTGSANVAYLKPLAEDLTVLIRADEESLLKYLTDIMDACRKNGLNKIRLQSR